MYQVLGFHLRTRFRTLSSWSLHSSRKKSIRKKTSYVHIEHTVVIGDECSTEKAGERKSELGFGL